MSSLKAKFAFDEVWDTDLCRVTLAPRRNEEMLRELEALRASLTGAAALKEQEEPEPAEAAEESSEPKEDSL